MYVYFGIAVVMLAMGAYIWHLLGRIVAGKKEIAAIRDANFRFGSISQELMQIRPEGMTQTIDQMINAFDAVVLGVIINLTWKNDDTELKVRCGHALDPQFHVTFIIGGQELYQWLFGGDHEPIDQVVTCVKQNLGISEPSSQPAQAA